MEEDEELVHPLIQKHLWYLDLKGQFTPTSFPNNSRAAGQGNTSLLEEGTFFTPNLWRSQGSSEQLLGSLGFTRREIILCWVLMSQQTFLFSLLYISNKSITIVTRYITACYFFPVCRRSYTLYLEKKDKAFLSDLQAARLFQIWKMAFEIRWARSRKTRRTKVSNSVKSWRWSLARCNRVSSPGEEQRIGQTKKAARQLLI